MPTDTAPPRGSTSRPVTRYERGRSTEDDDRLAEEVPVAVHLNGEPFAVMMATPLDLEDFGRGFALTEGLVGDVGQIAGVEVAEMLEGILVNVSVGGRDATGPGGIARGARSYGEGGAARNLPGRSGCGICGTRELEDVIRRPRPVAAGISVTSGAIELALDELRASQPINAFTGSVHAAAWARHDGALVEVREDVGRHNALDKLIGAMLRRGLDAREGFAVVTSRASYEMVTKAAVAGMTTLAAISAPTALAVHLAAECGMTLVGFARPGRFNIYTHPHRILLS